MPFAASMVNIITAIGTVLTASALVINAIAATRRDKRIEGKVDGVKTVGDQNHKMLNQDRTDRMNYQRALIRALEDKGIQIPIDQSVPPLEGDPDKHD